MRTRILNRRKASNRQQETQSLPERRLAFFLPIANCEDFEVSNSDNLRRCVQSLLDFVIEQLEEAKIPSGQQAGVVAAGGVIPYLRSKLSKDSNIAANVFLAFPFGRYVQEDWEDVWKRLADEPPVSFAKSADEIIDCIKTLKEVLEG